MRAVVSLLFTDVRYIEQWFRIETLSKLVVLLGFIIIAGITSLVIYGYSLIFFKNLALFESYGSFAARYILHAAVVLIAWFAIGSTIVASMGMFSGRQRLLSFIIPLPVSRISIVSWILIKSIVINSILFSLFLVPLYIAYGYAFGFIGGPVYFVNLLYVIAMLASVAAAIGNVIAYGALRLFGRQTVGRNFLGLALYTGSLVGLYRLIFSPSLATLTLPSVDFLRLYHTLPLNAFYVPTAWLTYQPIVQDLKLSIVMIIIISGIVAISLLMQAQWIDTLFSFLSSQSRLLGSHHHDLHGGRSVREWFDVPYPIIWKDVLSIKRTPSEMGYMVFLASIATFFFYLMYRQYSMVFEANEHRVELLIFSFLWTAFFVTAFYLRMVFPSMAKEGKSAWFLFSLPISKNTIFKEKLLFAVAVGVIFALIAWGMWMFLPFSFVTKTPFMVIGTLTVLILAVLEGLVGGISPNFSSSENPETISTSSMGMVILTITLVVVLVASIFLYWNAKGALSFSTLLIGFFVFCGIFLLGGFIAAKRSIKQYEF